MMRPPDEDELVRSVALKNAQEILRARRRTEDELTRAKRDLERTTEELARSIAMLRATLEATRDGILVTDRTGRITDFNEHFVAMWELPPAAMEARDHRVPLEAIARWFDDPDHFVTRAEEIDAQSPAESYDLLELTDGRVVERFSWLQVVGGQSVGRVWSFRDITEHRRAQQAQARLAAIVESSQDAVISKTLDGRILSWNAGAEQLFGWTAEEAVGRSILMLIPADRHDEEATILDKLRRGERLEHYDTVRISKEGRLIDISLTISPIFDRDGTIIGVSKIARDITARRRAEDTTRFLADASAVLTELTDEHSTLQKLAELAVPLFADWSIVYMQGADGSLDRLAVVHRDPARTQQVSGMLDRYPPRWSDSHGIHRVLRTGIPDWIPAVDEALLGEQTHNAGHLAMLRDIGLKSIVCVPVRSRGRTIGALGFVMAESGRTYTATDLAAAEAVAHRTAMAIENAHLLATLRQADARKDEFLAMLAHELRNPLAPIRNAVQIARGNEPLAPELEWATEVIDRQAQQLTRLVDDLLDVSRITRGKIELRVEPVELSTVIDRAVDASKPLIDKWGHELVVSAPSEPIPLRADPARLVQVLQNLLQNAAKYTDGKGRIWLSAAREGDSAVVRVKDTGVGIPNEMLPRVFEMFMQLGRSRDRFDGGLGIGLTLVKRLVEMHGGSVEAHSAGPGTGSEFVVRLPVAASAAASVGHLANGAPARRVMSRRILVVDDNRDAADSLGMLLHMMGHEVRTAYDGLEALGAVGAFGPELVLLDIGLPELSGYQVAQRIRQDDANRDVVLVALTGWGQVQDQRQSREAGFDLHVTKPIDFATLQDVVELSRPAAAARRG